MDGEFKEKKENWRERSDFHIDQIKKDYAILTQENEEIKIKLIQMEQINIKLNEKVFQSNDYIDRIKKDNAILTEENEKLKFESTHIEQSLMNFYDRKDSGNLFLFYNSKL